MITRNNLVLLDSSFVYELFDTHGSKHKIALEFVDHFLGRLILPEVAVTEIAFLFNRAGGLPSVQQFLVQLEGLEPEIEHLSLTDLQRVRAIMQRFQNVKKLDFVDCCIVALAERLDTLQVCTFDYRDFNILRTIDGKPITILPIPKSP